MPHNNLKTILIILTYLEKLKKIFNKFYHWNIQICEAVNTYSGRKIYIFHCSIPKSKNTQPYRLRSLQKINDLNQISTCVAGSNHIMPCIKQWKTKTNTNTVMITVILWASWLSIHRVWIQKVFHYISK